MKLKRRNGGFSLIELMVVVSIMAILATAGLTGYSSAQKKARDSRRKGDVRTMQNIFVSTTDSGGNYDLVAALASNPFPQDPSSNYKYIVMAPCMNPGKDAGVCPDENAQVTELTGFTDEELGAVVTSNLSSSYPTTMIVNGGTTVNGGFACAWMESASGGNVKLVLAEGGNNPFSVSSTVDALEGTLFGSGTAPVQVQRESYTLTSDCSSDCNAFCAVF